MTGSSATKQSWLLIGILSVGVGCSPSMEAPDPPIDDPNMMPDPAPPARPNPAPDPGRPGGNGDPQMSVCGGVTAPADTNCSCVWSNQECTALTCTCDSSCFQAATGCLIRPDSMGGGSSSDPTLSGCSAVCKEDDLGKVECSFSCPPPAPPPMEQPPAPPPVEMPPPSESPFCTGDCSCWNDEAEAPWPVGTDIASLPDVGGSNNWIILEDNPPKGGAIGPEDRQWTAQDGRVYAGTDADGNITGAPGNELGVPVGEDLGDVASFYAKMSSTPANCPSP